MKSKRLSWVLISNIILLVTIVILFAIYNKNSQDKLMRQNINDIVNINQSTANISTAFFEAQQDRILDICRYATHQQMSRTELLNYIEQSVAVDNESFQLIGSDYTGYIASQQQGAYIPVDYTNADYHDLHKIFTQQPVDDSDFVASFAPEFTDNDTGFKSFALYCKVPIFESAEQIQYDTLLVVSNTANFISYTNIDGGFDDFASVLINQSGDYILGNSAFKSTNFFQYLYVFNNLTMDEQKEIINTVHTQHKGELFYQNSNGQDCVFVYTEMPQTQWYCVSSVPLDSFHGQVNDFRFTALIVILLALLMMIDFTWLRHLNYTLQETAEEAEKANVAKTDFLSRMSHDIRTPLNVITGMTHLVLQTNQEPTIAKYLENIQSAGKFLTGLVNDILDLNKVESGKMELHPVPYSIKEFENYIDAIILPQCQAKNIAFDFNSNADPELTILIDSLRFNQIFFNLLSNAVKYTQTGGHIVFSMNITPGEGNQLQMNFVVEDNGIGMSQEFQSHLYETFSQENVLRTTEITGTGLGLAIVKSILDLMHGTIWLKSATGEGSTFYVQINTIQVPSVPTALNEKAIVSDAISIDTILTDKRILLCEDHPMNTVIVQQLLEKKGMHVDTAANGQIGLDLFNQSPPNYYSAILMDIQMPIMDGMTATREIRKLQRSDAQSVPIIAMTANAYDIDIQNSLDAGMNAHTAKPIEPELVYETLARFISSADTIRAQ